MHSKYLQGEITMKKSTRIITSVIMFLMIFIQAGCGSKSTTSEPSDTDFAEQMQEASTTPYGKYPELVTAIHMKTMHIQDFSEIF